MKDLAAWDSILKEFSEDTQNEEAGTIYEVARDAARARDIVADAAADLQIPKSERKKESTESTESTDKNETNEK